MQNCERLPETNLNKTYYICTVNLVTWQTENEKGCRCYEIKKQIDPLRFNFTLFCSFPQTDKYQFCNKRLLLVTKYRHTFNSLVKNTFITAYEKTGLHFF